MLESEIVSVKCERCEQMVLAHDGQEHPCWKEEQEMQVLEDAMWEKYQAEQAIEPAEIIDSLAQDGRQVCGAYDPHDATICECGNIFCLGCDPKQEEF